MSIVKGGTAFAGVPIGVLVLNAKYPLIPGNVANAKSYQFPVCFQIVDLPTRWWFELNEEKYQIFIQAAKKLEDKGVKAIICGCGLFVTWQERASEDLNIPIFTSPLLLVPMISKMIGKKQKVGILTAAGERLYENNFLASSGIDDNIPFVIGGIDTCSEFLDVIRYQKKSEMDVALFEKQVVNVAKNMLKENPDIGVFLLECSDIPPFSNAIATATGKPVFDFISAAHMIYAALEPPTYQNTFYIRRNEL